MENDNGKHEKDGEEDEGEENTQYEEESVKLSMPCRFPQRLLFIDRFFLSKYCRLPSDEALLVVKILRILLLMYFYY